MGVFPDFNLRNLMMLFALGGVLGAGFAICSVVHQDAIPGVRQDWLVRPIRRRDLLLGKLLWVVLMIQLPIFLADTIQGVASGFPLGGSFAAAVSRSWFLLLLIDIPMLAFASITRNLLEAVAGGTAIFAGIGVFIVLLEGSGRRLQPTLGSGEEWITASTLLVALLVGGAVILILQFFHRRTLLSRFITGGVAALGVAITMMPSQPVFAVQKTLAAMPGSGAAIQVSFAPELGKLKRDGTFPVNLGNEQVIPLFLPMRIGGLAENVGLSADFVEFRMIDAKGRVNAPFRTQRLAIRSQGGSRPDQTTRQMIIVPSDLYRRIKNEPIRAELEYSLTLFKYDSTYTLPAVNGGRQSAIGRCATRINAAETAVQLACQLPGQPPSCGVLQLEDTASGLRNPERFNCEQANYSPFFWELFPDVIERFGGNLPFRDPNGLAKYPVDGSKLQNARVVMGIYRPVDHFTRTLVIPEIKLSDWEIAPVTN